MKKTMLLDKYPINSLEIKKNETELKDVDAFITYFQKKIEEHPIAVPISIFDNYAHTASINGKIDKTIKGAKIVIFCFGAKLPSSQMLSIRPRTIGITEFAESFSIDFMDAPNVEFQVAMEEWTTDIIKK